MKGIKLILLSFMAAAMLTSCGMNNTNDNTSPSPESTVNTNNENNNIIMPELKPVQTDTIEIKKEESPKVKIIFEKNVPEAAIKEIYSSSTIMPGIYDYLNDGNNIINAGGALLWI